MYVIRSNAARPESALITYLVSGPGIASAWDAFDEREGGRGGGSEGVGLLLSLRGGMGGGIVVSVR